VSRINYDNRRFRPVDNSAGGEVDGETLFHYRQREELVWATYEGGGIRWGTLVATVDESGNLDMRYAHVNEAGELMTGVCRSKPEVLPDGRLRLHERWRWTSGDGGEGRSVLEEVAEEP
jgi:hypothetical protein